MYTHLYWMDKGFNVGYLMNMENMSKVEAEQKVKHDNIWRKWGKQQACIPG